MALNLDDIFRDVARVQPNSPAVIAASGVVTYAALDDLVSHFATVFTQAGIRAGDCVGIQAPNTVVHIAAVYAAWRCRACAVPVPSELAGPEQEAILKSVAIDYLVSPVASQSLAVYVVSEPQLLASSLTVSRLQLLRAVPPGFAALNPAFVRFTSGTTAAAKGVVLSHETIRERVQAANDVLKLTRDDRVVWLLSMAYHFAVTIVSYLSHGAAMILPAHHFADAILSAARAHHATLIYGSPAHYRWLAAATNAAPLPHLRLAISTTSPLNRTIAESFRERFQLPVTQALGAIEIGLPFINTEFAHDRPDCIGRLLPAYEMKLTETELAEAKLISLRGPGLFDAYYEPWRTRNEVLSDGWFTTGDIATIAADGCVRLCGRVTDVISVLGIKFFPQEVEAVLNAHPAVEAACVSSRPDARFGESVAAVIVLKPGYEAPPTAAMLEWCRHRLASAKVPQTVEYVSALPRTASGKLIHRVTTHTGGSS